MFMENCSSFYNDLIALDNWQTIFDMYIINLVFFCVMFIDIF